MKRFGFVAVGLVVFALCGAAPATAEMSECVQCQREAMQKRTRCYIEAGKDENELRGAETQAACFRQYEKDLDLCRMKPGCP